MNAIAANEPLSAQLRRLHEDINQLHSPSRSNRAVLNGLPREVVSISGQAPSFDMRAETHEGMAANGRLVAVLRNALPALADLVKFVESIADDNACHWQPMHERGERADCVGCCASGALAALREQLEARP